MTNVVDLLWAQYQNVIFKKVFMPYVIYFTSSLLYFTFFLRDLSDDSWFFLILDFALRLLVVANMIIFQALEVMQVQGSGFKEYITEFWNQVD